MSPPPLPLKFQLPPKLREAADKVAAVIVDDDDIDFADFDACDDDDDEAHKAAKAIEAAANVLVTCWDGRRDDCAVPVKRVQFVPSSACGAACPSFIKFSTLAAPAAPPVVLFL
eukprot:gene22636-biopygen23751